MATIYKKTYTKALPSDVEIFMRRGERFARWMDAKGKAQTAKVVIGKDGSERIQKQGSTYIAKYRNGAGEVIEKSTGCRSRDAGMSVLNDFLTRAEHVKCGILNPEQDAAADYQRVPLSQHIEDYINHLASKAGDTHCNITKYYLNRLCSDCSWSKLSDLSRSGLEKWLTARADEDMSARSMPIDA